MGSVLLIILGGLALWGLWYLFVKSVVWVFKPIAKYFQEKEEADNGVENNVSEEGSGEVIITVSSLQKNGFHEEERIEVGSSKKDYVAPNNVTKEEAKPEIGLKVFQSLKGKRQVRLICRCPKCHKLTTCYDVDTQKGRCTSCDWVNIVDPSMTLEEYVKVYYMLVDPSELGIKND